MPRDFKDIIKASLHEQYGNALVQVIFESDYDIRQLMGSFTVKCVTSAGVGTYKYIIKSATLELIKTVPLTRIG